MNSDLEMQIQSIYNNLENQKKLYQAKSLDYESLKKKIADQEIRHNETMVKLNRDVK